MRRADRLFEIIQALRASPKVLTAGALAERLEVTPRTIYRDIAALQARNVPIEGAPGIGYVLRQGYDLPPLTFTIEEIEAIAVGVRMIPPPARRGAAACRRQRAFQDYSHRSRGNAAIAGRASDLGFRGRRPTSGSRSRGCS